MYPSVRDRPAALPVARRARVARNVVFLGLTSLFTDVSSEMVNAVLPLYLTTAVGLTAFQFGIVDGLYQGVSAPLRVLGGFLADRWGRLKEVAGAGYGISAACKLGLAAAGNAWLAISGVLLLDRTGKGLRTAPRDALISLSAPRDGLGAAFGVHRALDTAGAMLGPLAAFLLLTAVPGAFDAIFVVSFCAALLGLGVLVLFVENRRPVPATGGPRLGLREAAGLLRGPGFRRVLAAGTLMALATVSDGFVYLTLQRRVGFAAGYFPLLYVATAAVYLLLAVPVGRLADRAGRARVFLVGQVVLLGVYALLLGGGGGWVPAMGALGLLGAYYAATDGVLAALASSVLPGAVRASGLALLATTVALARLASSVAFGAIWMWRGPLLAVAAFAGGLALALAASAILLRKQRGVA